jgi:hypothetical protein
VRRPMTTGRRSSLRWTPTLRLMISTSALTPSITEETTRSAHGLGCGTRWGSWRIEGLEVRPVGEDRAVALFVMVVTGKGSGIELSRHDALVCTLRAGKISEMGYYNDQQQALEAVGLAE